MHIWPSAKDRAAAASGRDHEGQGMARHPHCVCRPIVTLNALFLIYVSALASLGRCMLLLDIISKKFQDQKGEILLEMCCNIQRESKLPPVMFGFV